MGSLRRADVLADIELESGKFCLKGFPIIISLPDYDLRYFKNGIFLNVVINVLNWDIFVHDVDLLKKCYLL